MIISLGLITTQFQSSPGLVTGRYTPAGLGKISLDAFQSSPGLVTGRYAHAVVMCNRIEIVSILARSGDRALPAPAVVDEEVEEVSILARSGDRALPASSGVISICI